MARLNMILNIVLEDRPWTKLTLPPLALKLGDMPAVFERMRFLVLMNREITIIREVVNSLCTLQANKIFAPDLVPIPSLRHVDILS